MESGKLFHAPLSVAFMTATWIICCLGSFSVGKLSKSFLEQEMNLGFEAFDVVNGDVVEESRNGLPVPLAKDGKEIPVTIYTSKNFDTRRSAYSSQWLQKENPTSSEATAAPLNLRLSEYNETDSALEHDEVEEEHLPAGQHLLVDIDGIEAAFLNSEKQLATAMIELVDNSGLTLLSYHCHGLTPSGVSCAGVLLESHVSFHTWPEEGVITLDLFTCGSTSLLDSLDLIENLFARPRTQSGPQPTVLWAYKRRGFKEQTSLVGERDTFAYPLGIHGLEAKKEIASTQTSDGKHARIYDINNLYQVPYHSDAQSEDSSSMFPPTRMLYLDGVLKASEVGEVPAHESFVHPPMLTHDSPKNVLLLGAGTGANIREVLKHSTVQNLLVVGGDESLVQFSKAHLRNWNDCSDLVGSTDSCFDDPRVHVIYDSPKEWLSTRNSNTAYDVILVDFFDLDELDAADMLASQQQMFSDLKAVLSNDGVMALHTAGVARAVDSISTRRKGSIGNQIERHSKTLAEVSNAGFDSIKHYEETETGLIQSRNYIVAFQTAGSAKRWDRNEAEINASIHKRAAATKSGKLPLKFFDGATMMTYNRAETKETGQSDADLLKTMQERTLRKIASSPTIFNTDAVSVGETTQRKANQSLEVDASKMCSSDVTDDDAICEKVSVPSKQLNYHES